MYSQNYENGILEVLEIKTFFAAQPWWTDFLRIFVKLCGFYTCGTSEKFSKKVKMFWFIFLPLLGYSKSPTANKKLQKVEYNIKGWGKG